MPQPDKVIKINEDTWDQEAIDDSNSKPDSWNVYGASKTKAEMAIWKAAKDSDVPFQVACVLPNANFGPILQPGAEQKSSTAAWVVNLYKGDASVFDAAPPQWMVDVRDTARLHVIALIDPSCQGQRLFAFAEPFNFNDVIDVFRKKYPDKKFLDHKEDLGRDLSEIPNQKAEGLLKKHYGKGFTGLEEAVEAVVDSITP